MWEHGWNNEMAGIVANIFISFIGGGVLGLPFAFMKAGILEGTFIMLAVAFLSVKAMLLLIDCKYMAIHQNANPSSVKVNKGQKYMPVNQSDDNNSDDDENGKSSKSSSQRYVLGRNYGLTIFVCLFVMRSLL